MSAPMTNDEVLRRLLLLYNDLGETYYGHVESIDPPLLSSMCLLEIAPVPRVIILVRKTFLPTTNSRTG